MSQSGAGAAQVLQKGVVRKLREGYGFIAGNDGKDYFLHWTQMMKDTKNFRELQIGDRVEFTPLMGEKGPRAIDVLVIG